MSWRPISEPGSDPAAPWFTAGPVPDEYNDTDLEVRIFDIKWLDLSIIPPRQSSMSCTNVVESLSPARLVTGRREVDLLKNGETRELRSVLCLGWPFELIRSFNIEGGVRRVTIY